MKDSLVVLVDRQHQQNQGGISLAQQGKPLEAVNAGANLHQGHFGDFGPRPAERLFHGTERHGAPVARGAIDQHRQSFPDAAVVFNDRHADRAGSDGVGGRQSP